MCRVEKIDEVGAVCNNKENSWDCFPFFFTRALNKRER